MPLIFLCLLLFAFLFSPVSLAVKTPPPSSAEPTAAAITETHYTRSGIVTIDSVTGATRFVPYSKAAARDRRASTGVTRSI